MYYLDGLTLAGYGNDYGNNYDFAGSIEMPIIDYHNVGLAGTQTDTFTQTELFFGDTPLPVTEDAIVPSAIATAGLAANTPVFVDPATRVVALVEAGTPDVLPNAITVVEVAADSPADIGLSVYTAGHFNIHAINWPTLLGTEAERRSAFSATGSNQIRISVPLYNVS